MPPRPNLAQTARLAIYSHSSQEQPLREAANIMYLQWSPPLTPTVSELQTVANAALASWGARFKTFCYSSLVWDSAVVTMIDGSEVQVSSTGAAVAGIATNRAVPDNVAAVVSWPISSAYRGGHPRSYIMGLDTGTLAGGTSTNQLAVSVAQSIAADAAGFIGDMLVTAIGGSDTVVGTVSYVRNKTPRVTPVFFPYGIVPKVNTRLGSQRRRLGKLSVGSYQT